MTYDITLREAMRDPNLDGLLDADYNANGSYADVYRVTVETAGSTTTTTLNGYSEAA